MIDLLLKIEMLSNFDNLHDSDNMQNNLEEINELIIKELSKTVKTNDLDELFQKIKENVMDDYGYDEDDMEEDDVEDEVNEETRKIFQRIFKNK